MKLYSIFILLVISIFCEKSFAIQEINDSILQPKYLHILTNPYNADIFIGEINPDFAKQPDYKSPSFIKIPQSKEKILITLFQKNYADTTINVTLSPKDTSYLIVSLREHNDEAITEFQDKKLAHRARRTLGKNLLIASALPFITSAITAYITHRYIKSAKKDCSHIQNSIIYESNNYEHYLNNYNNNSNNAKTAKKIAAISLGTGLTLMSIGLILSF